MSQSVNQESAALAATFAALDPARTHWQHDILISAIIEVLARRGPCRLTELSNELKGSWVTSEIPKHLLVEALKEAQANDLIVTISRGDDIDSFDITPATRIEAKKDQEWARRLQERFDHDVLSRLRSEFGDEIDGRPIESKAAYISQLLVRSMVSATVGLFAASSSGNGALNIAALRVNLPDAIPELRANITPPALAEAAGSLLLDAANPGDNFGDEILRTIGTGQILHGMVCRRDLPVSTMDPIDLVLDTSELLRFVDSSQPSRELFSEFLNVAKSLDAKVYIPVRVSSEWKTLWENAELEAARVPRAGGYAGFSHLIDSPILKAYQLALSEDPTLTWTRWSRHRKSLIWHLDAGGYTYAVSDPPPGVDQDLVDRIAARLLQPDSHGRPSKRGPKQAETDGISAGWVAHRRDGALSGAHPIAPRAWFVAQDRRTASAYREERPEDHFPVVITADLFLLRYSAHYVATRAEQAQLAKRLAESAVMQSFISVASSFTTEDISEIESLIDSGVTIDDVTDAIRAAFWDETDSESRDKVAKFSRRRSRRREDRAERDATVAAEAAERAEAERREAAARATELAGALTTSQNDHGAERQSLTDQVRRWKRLSGALLAAAAIAAGLVALFIWGPFTTGTNVAIAAVTTIFCLVASAAYVRDLNRSAWVIASELILAAAGIGGGVLLDQLR